MGRGHVTVGAAMWAGAVVAAAPVIQSNPALAPVASVPAAALILVGTAPVMGASLLPDIDHTNGTISNSMGWFTKVLTKIVSVISGGHRQATHGLWFWILVTGLAFGVHQGSLRAPQVGQGDSTAAHVWSWAVEHGNLLTFFMLTAFGQRALGAKWVNAVFSKVWRSQSGAVLRAMFFVEAAILTWIAMAVFPEPEQWIWLPFAVSIGHFSHLVADSLTTARVQWFWPSERKFGLPLIGDAGSVRETYFSIALTILYVLAVVRAISL